MYVIDIDGDGDDDAHDGDDTEHGNPGYDDSKPGFCRGPDQLLLQDTMESDPPEAPI